MTAFAEPRLWRLPCGALRPGLEDQELRASFALFTGHGDVEPAAAGVEQAGAGLFDGGDPFDDLAAVVLFHPDDGNESFAAGRVQASAFRVVKQVVDVAGDLDEGDLLTRLHVQHDDGWFLAAADEHSAAFGVK